jgi:uncharacterized protein (TIRG00374 family)
MTIEGHKQNWLGLAMRLILVVVIFAMISMRLDLSRAGEVLSRTDLRLASVAFALFVLNRLLTAIKWGMLLRCGGVHVRLSRLVRIMFESNLLGIMIPSGLGVDLVRMVQLGKQENAYTESAGSVLADRLLAVMTLASIAILAALSAWRMVVDPVVLCYVLGVSALLVILILVVMGDASFRIYAFLHDRVVGWMKRIGLMKSARLERIADTIRREASNIHAGFRDVMSSPRVFWAAIGVNVVVQLVRVAQVHCLFIAIGAEVPLILELTFVPIIILITLLPFCPYMGLGVKEAAFIYFFGTVGVNSEIAFSASILSHLVVIAGVLPGAILFFIHPREVGSEETQVQ